MKIVFLDIDGVIAPFDGNYGSAFKDFYSGGNPKSRMECQAVDIRHEHVDRLNTILDQTGASVVVHSTRRRGFTVGELQTILEMRGFTGKVIDKTGNDKKVVRGNYKIPLQRHEQIQKWLDDNSFEGVFAILDDDWYMGHLSKHLIAIDSGPGIQDADVEEAVNKLGLIKSEKDV